VSLQEVAQARPPRTIPRLHPAQLIQVMTLLDDGGRGARRKSDSEPPLDRSMFRTVPAFELAIFRAIHHSMFACSTPGLTG
jgi:hypothetical protein